MNMVTYSGNSFPTSYPSSGTTWYQKSNIKSDDIIEFTLKTGEEEELTIKDYIWFIATKGCPPDDCTLEEYSDIVMVLEL